MYFATALMNPIYWQVYQGLDVLTNKVPVQARKGPCFIPFNLPVVYVHTIIYSPEKFLYLYIQFCVTDRSYFTIYIIHVSFMAGMQHHLLGTVSPNVAFTAKDFRDCAIPVRQLLMIKLVFIWHHFLLCLQAILTKDNLVWEK